jgi:hypothetical protein
MFVSIVRPPIRHPRTARPDNPFKPSRNPQ